MPKADAMLAAQYRFVPIAKLPPYPKNAQIHTRADIEAQAEAIKAFGWTVAVVADQEGIIGGHKRVQAAELIYSRGGVIRLATQMPDGEPIPVGTVPVLWADAWTPAQRRAYVLAENAHARRAETDPGIVAEELAALQLFDWDLGTLGWTETELDEFLSVDGAGSGQEEEEQEQEEEYERGQPLAIVLQREELRRWRQVKDGLGLTLDRAALLKLIDLRLEEKSDG
jgi:hypothetical protein